VLISDDRRTIPASLSNDHLRVEAGGTVEATLDIGPVSAIEPGEAQDVRISVKGIPPGWFSLSAAQPVLRFGESVRLLLVVHPPVNDDRYPLGQYEFAIHVETEGANPADLEGIVFAIAPGAETLQSRFIEYLPRIYQGDEFLSRFLLIFQSLLDPVEQSVDNIPNLLDPDLTPPRFLSWLASWVGVTLDPGLDEATQRTLIRNAVRISRWKGTRRGLREEVRIRSGARPLIVENFDGLRIGQDAALGMNTYLGAIQDGFIAVTLALSSDRALALADAERLIAEIKPAHVGQIVRLVAVPNGQGSGTPALGSAAGQASDRGERSG